MAKPEINASSKHLREISDEIGCRLGQWLNRTTEAPSAQLAAVLRRFEQPEPIDAPSIVPSLELADESLQTEQCG